MRPNPFAVGRALRVVGALFVALGGVAFAAWPLSAWLGESVLPWVGLALPPVAFAAIHGELQRQRRLDATPTVLRIDAGELILSRPSVTLLRAPLSAVRASTRVYRAGGRTVARLPCLELAGDSWSLAVALPDPRHEWPGAAPEATPAPAYVVDPGDWSALLDALGVPRTYCSKQ